ncbi:hypothetical protein BDZ89DRAFT_1035555 [Hymenopellis radicata]|nr:hypothetical protein BDZ89DRAFT_1035555 [Hymenopellis radicata]
MLVNVHSHAIERSHKRHNLDVVLLLDYQFRVFDERDGTPALGTLRRLRAQRYIPSSWKLSPLNTRSLLAESSSIIRNMGLCSDVPSSQDPSSKTVVVTNSAPPPATITQSQSVTLSDGQITVQYGVHNSYEHAAAVTMSAVASSSSSSSSNNLGAIIGTVGGIMALLGLAALLYYL